MRYSAFVAAAALAVPSLVAAYPLGRRNASAADILVLQFAEALQHLEDEFYKTGMANFTQSDFTNAGFSSSQLVLEQFTSITNDEETHASILDGALASFGAKPVSGCSFNFGNTLSNVPTMVATARVVENVGVAAFLGAAHLIDDPVLLTAAGTILTVEARHQTVLNLFAGTGSSIPAAFDIALTPNEVLAIAGSFISGCDLGVPANPPLAVANTGTIAAGTQLQLQSPAISGDTGSLTCQMLTGGATFALTFPFDACVVPGGLDGPVAIFVTNDTQPLAGNVRDRATNKLVAGPLMTFVDSVQQQLPQLARVLGGAPSAVSNATAPTSDASPVSPPAPAASPANVPAPNTPGGMNTTTGPVDGGAVIVKGFTTVSASSV